VRRGGGDHEEERLVRLLKHLFPRTAFNGGPPSPACGRNRRPSRVFPPRGHRLLLSLQEKNVLVLQDIHPLIADPHFVRPTDARVQLKGTGKILVLTALR